MHMPAMGHGPMWGRSHPWGGQYMMPAPMALFGTLMGLILGTMMGMLLGKKGAMMSHAGMRGMGGMKKMHHHHGWGMEACMAKHHGGGAKQQAAPGAASGEERDEGE